MKLEDIADIRQGITLSRIRIEENIEKENRTVYSFEKETKVLVPKDMEKLGQKIPVIKKDMILFNMVSYNAKKATEPDVGKIVPSNYVMVEVKDKSIDSDYLAWHMDQSESFKRELHKLIQGSLVLSLPVNEFRKMTINLPKIEIQKKIGKISKLTRRRQELFLERQNLIEKSLMTIDREELING